MPYNFVADSFTQRNFIADFLRTKSILDGNRPFCVWAPSGGRGGGR